MSAPEMKPPPFGADDLIDLLVGFLFAAPFILFGSICSTGFNVTHEPSLLYFSQVLTMASGLTVGSVTKGRYYRRLMTAPKQDVKTMTNQELQQANFNIETERARRKLPRGDL